MRSKSNLEDIVKDIEDFQNKLIEKHKKGNHPQCCKECTNLKLAYWSDKDDKKFSWIPLNHDKICNLKCVHMIKMLKSVDAKYVSLSFDLNIKKEDYEKYREPINKFIDLCKKEAINVVVNSFVPQQLIEKREEQV